MQIEMGHILVDFPVTSFLVGILFQIWPKRLWLGPLLAGLFQIYMVFYFGDLEYYMWVVINVVVSFIGALMVYGIQRTILRSKDKKKKLDT
ncbi:hypothetical protein JOD24_002622 [Kroppenstedtia sanguinis]|uniref:hypothetical protein n=1 Tax=Kroppenstedtia sanguinis TaxID=1380684 RepID=UPI003D21EE2F